MTVLRLLSALTIAYLITATASHGTGLQCDKPNEEARSVAKCPPQKTCRTRDIMVKCLQSAAEQYDTKCVCKDGYYRNSGGDCVTSEDCDKCFGQNQYYSCRKESDKLCTDLKKSDAAGNGNNEGSNQPVNEGNARNATKCKPQCYCDPGTARDENNECVPYGQCNLRPESKGLPDEVRVCMPSAKHEACKACSSGEIKDYCPTDSPNDYCPKKDLKSVRCPKPTPCPKPKCKCRFNSRRAANGTCISTRDCPPFKCKKPFEVYNPCPLLCPNGSCGQATPSGRCPAIFGRIGIVLECSPECRCKEGYWWNEDKICVPYNQCPGKGDAASTLNS